MDPQRASWDGKLVKKHIGWIERGVGDEFDIEGKGYTKLLVEVS